MSGELVVTVTGRPAPQGSKRHVGGGRMVESSAAVGPWRDAIRAEASAAAVRQRWVTPARAVSLYVVFTLPRPAGHYRTGRYADLLRPNAPPYPETRPDLDKLIRSTLDALTDAGVITDDGLVVAIEAVKAYPAGHLDALDTPGAVLVLTPLPRTDKDTPDD
jgi:Holliday junction resolvase RusA-like endonuclease